MQQCTFSKNIKFLLFLFFSCANMLEVFVGAGLLLFS